LSLAGAVNNIPSHGIKVPFTGNSQVKSSAVNRWFSWGNKVGDFLFQHWTIIVRQEP